MSTRSNIVVKQEVNGTAKYQQIYHHYDGYPSGVGSDLQNTLNELMKKSDDKKKKVLTSPLTLADYINEKDISYEVEGKLNLHGDIEYLYVIDLDTQTITCFSVCMWDCESSDEDFVNGNANKIINSSIGGQRKEQVCVYEIGFDAEPTDEEFDAWGEVSCYDVEEDEGSNYEDWETSDLEQFIREEATVADVLNAVDCELCDEDYHHFLAAVTKYLKD